MKLIVNNQETELAGGETLTHLAQQLQLPPQGVAIAVNNRMIPRTEWDGHVLQEGDRLVIIKAACGG